MFLCLYEEYWDYNLDNYLNIVSCNKFDNDLFIRCEIIENGSMKSISSEYIPSAYRPSFTVKTYFLRNIKFKYQFSAQKMFYLRTSINPIFLIFQRFTLISIISKFSEKNKNFHITEKKSIS